MTCSITHLQLNRCDSLLLYFCTFIITGNSHGIFTSLGYSNNLIEPQISRGWGVFTNICNPTKFLLEKVPVIQCNIMISQIYNKNQRIAVS